MCVGNNARKLLPDSDKSVSCNVGSICSYRTVTVREMCVEFWIFQFLINEVFNERGVWVCVTI